MEAGIARMRDNNLPETVIGAIVVAVAVLAVLLAVLVMRAPRKGAA